MLDRLLGSGKLHMKSVIQDILLICLNEVTLEGFLQAKWWSGKRNYLWKITVIATDTVKTSILTTFRKSF